LISQNGRIEQEGMKLCCCYRCWSSQIHTNWSIDGSHSLQ